MTIARRCRLRWPALLCVAAVLTTSATCLSQRRVTVAVAGGLTPTVALSAASLTYTSGAHAQVSAERARLLGGTGIRVDAFIHGFARPSFNGFQSGQTSVFGASASLVLPLVPEGSRLQPYLLAGSGTYRTDLGGRFHNPEWHHGLSVGGGLEWARGRTRPFIESRVIKVYDGSTPRLFPVSIGVRF